MVRAAKKNAPAAGAAGAGGRGRVGGSHSDPHDRPPSSDCQIAAQFIGRLLAGKEITAGEGAALAEPYRAIAEQIARADRASRYKTFEAAMAALPDQGQAEQFRAEVDSHAREGERPEKATQRIAAHFSDLGNSERFILDWEDRVLHDFSAKTDYVYMGWGWARDDRGEWDRLAKGTVQRMYADAAQVADEDLRKLLAKWALRSESANRQQNMLRLARSAVPVSPDEFDRDPWLFNCKNGTIDLRTGELRPHRREDLITNLSPVEYDPEARLEVWDQFLASVTNGDQELLGYLQRAVGYTLTGLTSQEKLFLIVGPTRTGKSTFLEALRSAMGSYGKTADFGTFLKGHDVGKPRADIARLEGARLVISVEVQVGSGFAEALVKQLTGQDSVAARGLYQDTREWLPQMKPWLAANDLPRVSDRDSAMWERIARIPFIHQVPVSERDPTVKERLRDPKIGGPAILAWAVQGCLAWQKQGLGSCGVVDAATREYREGQDPLREFLDGSCVLASGAWVSARELRTAYEAFAAENGARWTVGGGEWGERLRALGCEPEIKRVADKTVRGWRGIGLVGSPIQAELARDEVLL